MPSTEFLLYLVLVIFVIYVLMNYYQNNVQLEPRYRYIPVYNQSSNGNRSTSDDNSMNSNRSNMSNNSRNRRSRKCVNPTCRQYGRCMCQQNGSILINNDTEEEDYPYPPHHMVDPLRLYDERTVNDDFTPPYRRSLYEDNLLHPGLYPLYTRGPPGRFRKVGMLIADGVASNDKYKFLLLMGRQKYIGREYEYFASSVDADQRLKFYIETRGKEISDGDIVKIPELEGYTYRFREDQDLSPKYDPYII